MKKIIGALVLFGLVGVALLFVGIGRQPGAYHSKPQKAIAPKEVKRTAKMPDGGSVSGTQKLYRVTFRNVPVVM